MALKQVPASDERRLNLRSEIYKQLTPVLCVRLYSKPCSIVQVLKQGLGEFKTNSNSSGEEQFVLKILKGHLIYPWNKIQRQKAD